MLPIEGEGLGLCFNNISVISVEESRVPGEIHRLVANH
jgi:hypothetical protein